MKFRSCTDQLGLPDGKAFTEQEILPKGFVDEILTLLDRIEIEDDHTLASQRFEIAEKYGITVEIGEPLSGAIN
jgi:hypothetical protein